MLWAPATGVSAGRVLRRVRGAAEGLKLTLETRPKDKDPETRPLLNHPFEPQLAPSPARAQHHVARVHALAPAPTRSMPRLACQAPARLFSPASMGNPFLDLLSFFLCLCSSPRPRVAAAAAAAADCTDACDRLDMTMQRVARLGPHP